MMIADVFVGTVAVVIGLGSLVAAVTNHEFFYQFPKIRWIEQKGGRGAARAVYTLLGTLLIVLGAAVACGFRFNLMRPSERPADQKRPAANPPEAVTQIDVHAAWRDAPEA
jgi:hypothetical protein